MTDRYHDNRDDLSHSLRSPTPIESSHTRSGLPKGFVRKPNRYGRSHLLEENIYRLPDGQEFVPCIPSGALGSTGHRYALLSLQQHEQGQRGSVYVRNDGRIFDYSRLASVLGSDLFDTGFTIEDLERTGRYTNRVEEKKARSKRKAKPSKSRASHG